MASTITLEGTTTKVLPLLVDGYTSSRPIRHVVHEVLGNGTAEVTFRPSPRRAGTLRLLFATETAATDAETQLRKPSQFSLTDPDRPSILMVFVVVGTLVRQLDDESRELWVLEVPYQEIAFA
jgi:hypothetical protein